MAHYIVLKLYTFNKSILWIAKKKKSISERTFQINDCSKNVAYKNKSYHIHTQAKLILDTFFYKFKCYDTTKHDHNNWVSFPSLVGLVIWQDVVFEYLTQKLQIFTVWLTGFICKNS